MGRRKGQKEKNRGVEGRKGNMVEGRKEGRMIQA